jgi:hypothetical protein
MPGTAPALSVKPVMMVSNLNGLAVLARTMVPVVALEMANVAVPLPKAGA